MLFFIQYENFVIITWGFFSFCEYYLVTEKKEVCVQEKDIIQLILKKDERGAEELLRSYGPLMRYIIKPILKSDEDMAECISDICMRVWNNIDKFDADKGSWTGWLTVISRNTAISFLKKNQDSGISDVLDEELEDSAPQPADRLIQKEEAKRLKSALSELSQSEYMLFYRKYYYRQTAAQIAREMGITTKAAERRLDRIKEKLRKRLSEENH